MTGSCCFPKCRNKSGRGCPYTFHRIPRYDIPLRRRWLAALQREITTPPGAIKQLHVCSYHFSEHDYVRSWRDKSQRPKLRYSAVPVCQAAPPVLRTWQNGDLLNPFLKARGGDTHIAEEDGGRSKDEGGASHKMDVKEEKEVKEEQDVKEEVDNVYIIEYTNAEEEGESYQVTMTMDHSLLDKSADAEPPMVSPPPAAAPPPPPKPPRAMRPKQKKMKVCVKEEKKEHVRPMHDAEARRSFFCTTCRHAARSQAELDWHTRRHANQAAVYTCPLCSEPPAYAGNRWGLKRHLQKEHGGAVPDCGICEKSFRSLEWYLAHQFRHVGATPHFCAKCQIYEMTERGLNVHIESHGEEEGEMRREAPSAAAV